MPHQLNPNGSNLDAEDYLFLFWFHCQEEGIPIEIKKYEEFQINQSLIQRYNSYIQKWNYAFNNNILYKKPVDWDLDRPKTDNYRKQLNSSAIFENWVNKEFLARGIDLGFFEDSQQYTGETQKGLEIKNDERSKITGNLYIEYQEKLSGDKEEWSNSGILKDDNTIYWIIGHPDEYYFFKKQDLLEIYYRLERKDPTLPIGFRFVEEKTEKTSKGFLIPKTQKTAYCFSSNIDDFIKKVGW